MTGLTPEDRQMLHDSLTSYFQDNYTLQQRQTHLETDNQSGYSRKDWANYAELGWLSLTTPESLGGLGGGMTETGILCAAAGRHLILEPIVSTLVLAVGALAELGNPSQKALLEQIAAGDRVATLSHFETRGGFDRGFVETVAVKAGQGYKLTGEKSFVIGVHAADHLIVSARLGDEEGPVALFLLDGDAAGVTRKGAIALDERPGAALIFDGAPAALLGGVETDRMPQLNYLLDKAILATCAEAVGAMAAVSELTTQYLKTRQQFGKNLSDFQVLQHRLVDMHLHSDECRMMVGFALNAADTKQENWSRLCAQTKVKVARSARFVGGQGIQLHGGMGMTEELEIGHYYKRLSVCEAAFGDAAWHLAGLANTKGSDHA